MSVDGKVGCADSEKSLSLSSDASIPDKSKDPVVLKNFNYHLRHLLQEMCDGMSRVESFEFHLRSRFDYRYIPHASDAPPMVVENGLAYHVTDADWLGPDGETIRKIVEDDGRYHVDWGNPGKGNGVTVHFIPQEVFAHMLYEKDDLSTPSDAKARSLFEEGIKVNEKGLSVSNPSPPDTSNPDKSKDPLFLLKYNTYLRQLIGKMCCKMSPQESFEFRLRSRFDYRYVPHATETPPVRVEEGLAYDITDPDWLGPDGRAIRELVENGDGYSVDWGKPGKDNRVTVRVNLYSFDPSAPLDPNALSDPALLQKVNLLIAKTRQALLDQKMDLYKNLGAICTLLSPRESFMIRLQTKSLFEEGIWIFESNEGQDEFICFDGTKSTDFFDVHHSREITLPEYKHFLESDSRYSVGYILGEMDKETRADGGIGTIYFKANAGNPLPFKEDEDE